jgi:hypothetical protein
MRRPDGFLPPLLLLVACVFASADAPDIAVHYGFSGPGGRKSEIILEKAFLYRIATEGKSDSLVCRSAILKPGDSKELLKRVGRFRVMTTVDDSNYECAGSRFMSIRLGAESIRLHEACKPRKTGMDSAVDRAMDSLSNFLSGIVERDNEKCPEKATAAGARGR